MCLYIFAPVYMYSVQFVARYVFWLLQSHMTYLLQNIEFRGSYVGSSSKTQSRDRCWISFCDAFCRFLVTENSQIVPHKRQTITFALSSLFRGERNPQHPYQTPNCISAVAVAIIIVTPNITLKELHFSVPIGRDT